MPDIVRQLREIFRWTEYAPLILYILFPSFVFADIIIGGDTVYYVVKGDTLQLIGAKLGVNWSNLVRENKIDIKKNLKIGQEIRANNRKIVPRTTQSGIIINIPDRMLYFFREGKLMIYFPVGLGKPAWKTPEGKFTVIAKEKNPTWHVPESIQEEMEMNGEIVKTVVPPGPDNPLGRYAVKTSMQGILIHETIWPMSVYQFRSHGCIRVLSRDMEKFFPEVEKNMSGEILYNPVKIAVTEKGRIFLEVHRDIYGKMKDLNGEVKQLIGMSGYTDNVDWKKVEKAVKEKSGIAEDITL
jgi:L,D-transpeptidase ErfK/SrfK